MKKLNLALLLLVFTSPVLANAVKALKSYIPLYQHAGVNNLGQRCSIDFFGRADGSLTVEIETPRFFKFILRPEYTFVAGPDSYIASAPALAENDGTVVMSLVFKSREVLLERNYCVGDKCWVSGSTCLLDSWN